MRVTLTFDNGPHPDITPQILDVLAARQVFATFFVLGQNVATSSGMELARAAAAQGHRIGNHTYSHSIPFGDLTNFEVAIDEVAKTQDLIEELNPSRIFRPFGGGGQLTRCLLNSRIVSYLQANEYSIALWNSVPRDWEDPEGWVEDAKRQVGLYEWSVVVLHDIPDAALRRLPVFLDWLIEEGAEFRQDFPPDCLPMAAGKIIGQLDHLITAE